MNNENDKLLLYIDTKINQLNELLMQYAQQYEEETQKESPNEQIQLIITGKSQAYYSIIKNMRAERTNMELASNVNIDNDSPKLKSSNET